MTAGRHGGPARAYSHCLLALAAVAAAAIGCGGGDDDGPGELDIDQPGAGIEAEEAGKLRLPRGAGAGEIAVVDLRRRATVRPRRLDFAADASLVGARWRGWGGPEATGTGRVRTVVCTPTCASGGSRLHRGRVVLSDPVSCDGRRFYGAARVAYRAGGKLRRPAAYIEAPC